MKGNWKNTKTNSKSLRQLREKYTKLLTASSRSRRDASFIWRKSRIAARILLRYRRGFVTKRDFALAPLLVKDPSVTNRLIDQGIAQLKARYANAHRSVASKP